MNQHPGLHIVHNGLRRSCADLGICQCRTPACEECDDPADSNPYSDPLTTGEMVAVSLIIIFTVLTIIGGAGWLYGHFHARLFALFFA